MAQRDFSIKTVTTAYVAASGASITTATVAGLLWRHWGGDVDFPTWIGLSWSGLVGVPSMLAAADYLMYALGKKKPTSINITADTRAGSVAGGRQIPVNYGDKTTTIFASTLELLSGRGKAIIEQPTAPALPHSFVVDVSGNSYTLSVSTVDDFLRATWRRQLSGKAGLARRYHIESRRPRMAETDYKAMIYLLASAQGLVVDRGDRRSGRLSLPPATALAHLQALYAG